MYVVLFNMAVKQQLFILSVLSAKNIECYSITRILDYKHDYFSELEQRL